MDGPFWVLWVHMAWHKNYVEKNPDKLCFQKRFLIWSKNETSKVIWFLELINISEITTPWTSTMLAWYDADEKTLLSTIPSGTRCFYYAPSHKYLHFIIFHLFRFVFFVFFLTLLFPEKNVVNSVDRKKKTSITQKNGFQKLELKRRSTEEEQRQGIKINSWRVMLISITGGAWRVSEKWEWPLSISFAEKGCNWTRCQVGMCFQVLLFGPHTWGGWGGGGSKSQSEMCLG